MPYREVDNPVKEIKKIADERVKDGGRNIQLYVVTAVDFEDTATGLIKDYKCSVKNLVTKVQYDNVPIVGLGLGNFKGVLKYPNVDDFVLCAFFDNSPTPFVLGTLFDRFTQSPDSIPEIKLDELILINKEFGSAIYMTQDNRILLKSSDPEDGNFLDALSLKRAQITLNPGTGAIPGSIVSATDGAMTDTVGLALTQTVGAALTQAVIGAWTVTVGGLWTVLTTGTITLEQAGTGAGIFIDASGNVTLKGKTFNFVKV